MTQTQAGGGVLVVDDEDEILELLEEYLKVRGYRPWTARNGREALERIHSEPIDVILTDLKMPGLGGIELLEEVAALARPMAVVMMTGFGTVETAIHAMKLGAADYVLKPFKLRDIHKALGSAHQRVETIRQQRLDAGLRNFYEHCHAIERESQIGAAEQIMIEFLVRRQGSLAAGIWRNADGKWEAEQCVGDQNALQELEAMVSATPMRPGEHQLVQVMSSETSRVIAIRLEPSMSSASVMQRTLVGLERALWCTHVRLGLAAE